MRGFLRFIDYLNYLVNNLSLNKYVTTAIINTGVYLQISMWIASWFCSSNLEHTIAIVNEPKIASTPVMCLCVGNALRNIKISQVVGIMPISNICIKFL